MAAVRGKTAEETTPEVPATEEAPALSQEEREGALANLLGPAVVSPVDQVEPVEPEAEPVVALDGLVSVTVLFDRYQHNPGTGWVNARHGDIIRVSESEATRGIRLGGLKANA